MWVARPNVDLGGMDRVLAAARDEGQRRLEEIAQTSGYRQPETKVTVIVKEEPWGTHYRGPLLIQEPGLVVQSGGHMRAYFGRAYIPDQVPQGVNIEEIK